MGNGNKDYTDTLQSIFEFIQPQPDEIIAMSIKEIRKELVEEGFDVDGRLEKAKRQFDVIATRVKLNSAKLKRETVGKEILSRGLVEHISDAKSALENFLSSLSLERRGLITAHYRNFEEFKDDDIITLLNDLKILEEMKNVNSGNNEG
jgi:hypothetical protein